MAPPSDRFVAETSFYVRYAETDAMAIVHHASYIVYFEEGRTTYARMRGNDYANFEKNGFFLAVTEVNARYSQPSRFGDRLTIRTWIQEMRSRGLTFAYEIIDAASGDLRVQGSTKHIWITREGKVTTIPAEWRAWGNSL